MKIAIANDHAATEMKRQVVAYLREQGHEIINYGTDSTESVDYADYAKPVALDVQQKKVDFGILICGTGVGISLAANKIAGIRAAVCSESATARLVKAHNDANIIAFGARIIGIETAKDILDVFMHTEFEGGRHQKRIDKITAIENEHL